MLLTKLVFLDKASEGRRTIGLTVVGLRVWSRMRAPVAKAWEQAHREESFWGEGDQSLR